MHQNLYNMSQHLNRIGKIKKSMAGRTTANTLKFNLVCILPVIKFYRE